MVRLAPDRSLSISRWNPDAPLLLAPVMRLATKYQVGTVRKRVVDIIEDSWPRSFEQWLRFNGEVSALQKLYKTGDKSLTGGKPFADHIPEPAAAIRFAREFDVPSILPFAYYVLAGIPSTKDWDRYHHIPALNDVLSALPVRVARWGLLDNVDLLRVLSGREELVWHIVSNKEWVDIYTVKTALINSEENCSADDSSLCSTKADEVLKRWEEDMSVPSRAVGCPDPLSVLEHMCNGQQAWGLCEECTAEMQRWIREQQKGIWHTLTDTFQLQ